MKILLLVITLFVFSGVVSAQDWACSPPKENESTHWIGNLQITVTEKKPYRQLRGTVVSSNGGPLADALVEVFTNPEYLLTEKPSDMRGRPNQVRVAACPTGSGGKFSFANLPAGRYELRSSSEDSKTGWNVTQMYVVVKPSANKKRELRVEMSLGI